MNNRPPGTTDLFIRGDEPFLRSAIAWAIDRHVQFRLAPHVFVDHRNAPGNDAMGLAVVVTFLELSPDQWNELNEITGAPVNRVKP